MPYEKKTGAILSPKSYHKGPSLNLVGNFLTFELHFCYAILSVDYPCVLKNISYFCKMADSILLMPSQPSLEKGAPSQSLF